jgi:menaquinone-dependent protoporphyrinogen oxidase
MARVLVAYGTKMGGTAGIAERIAQVLAERGHEAVLTPPAKLSGRFDAAVVGSALYAGRWRSGPVKALRRLARQHPPPPTWLFHSGPLAGDADEPQELPKGVASLAARLGARDVVTFGGRLDEEHASGWIARAMIRNGKGGDWRDLDGVAAWAHAVADEIAGGPQEA